MKPSLISLMRLSIRLFLLLSVQVALYAPTIVSAQQEPPQTFLLKSNTWEQLVLPGNPSGETVGSLFGGVLDVNTYGNDWIVYTYNGDALSYESPGVNGIIDQAQAFWIIQITGADVLVTFPGNFPDASVVAGSSCTSTSGCVVMPLATNTSNVTWTMTGIPYKQSIPTDQIRIDTNSTGSACVSGCTLDQAAQSGYLRNNLWGYDSATNSYIDQKNNPSLVPLHGFWVTVLPAAHAASPRLLMPPRSEIPNNSPGRKLPGEPHSYVYDGNEIVVRNINELQSAISNAQAGDVITLSSGLYFAENKLSLNANGTESNPIVMRAAQNRQAEVNFSQQNGFVEGFVVRGNHWIIDGLLLSSDCLSTQHSRCEHAIHVKSNADGLIIRNSKIEDFNAAIKGGGSNNTYADNVRIEHNEIYNSTVRMTSNPVTPIDINGGDSWLIYKNFIYDFVKGSGNRVSYGAFLKANSSNGTMDSNKVQCRRNVVSSGARIGLSFGGGGNSPINSPICTNSDCSILHRNGRMTNNLISDCSDVGIYINSSSDTLIDHNTLFSTAGIDIRYETSTARIIANTLVNGDISERQGGQVTQSEANTLTNTNLIPSLSQLLNAISTHSVTDPALSYDICGYQRQSPLVGAIGGTPPERATCVSGLQ